MISENEALKLLTKFLNQVIDNDKQSGIRVGDACIKSEIMKMAKFEVYHTYKDLTGVGDSKPLTIIRIEPHDKDRNLIFYKENGDEKYYISRFDYRQGVEVIRTPWCDVYRADVEA